MSTLEILKSMRRHGIHTAQGCVLLALAQHPRGMHSADLCEAANIDRMSLPTALRALEKRGLVRKMTVAPRRSNGPGAPRTVRYVLTREGQRVTSTFSAPRDQFTNNDQES